MRQADKQRSGLNCCGPATVWSAVAGTETQTWKLPLIQYTSIMVDLCPNGEYSLMSANQL